MGAIRSRVRLSRLLFQKTGRTIWAANRRLSGGSSLLPGRRRRLAIEEINERGGILGREIQAVVIDGPSDERAFARQAIALIAEAIADFLPHLLRRSQH
jgi:hypothetical protein